MSFTSTSLTTMRSSTPSTSRAMNRNTILANSNFRVLALERQITDTTEYDEVCALNPFLSKYRIICRIVPWAYYNPFVPLWIRWDLGLYVSMG